MSAFQWVPVRYLSLSLHLFMFCSPIASTNCSDNCHVFVAFQAFIPMGIIVAGFTGIGGLLYVGNSIFRKKVCFFFRFASNRLFCCAGVERPAASPVDRGRSAHPILPYHAFIVQGGLLGH
jgi:hypothetical protein